jgi:hypothetical protein
MPLSFYGESLGGHGFVTVLSTIVLQVPLDRAHGELPSDTRTLISHWERLRGKIGEIWRSGIAINIKLCLAAASVLMRSPPPPRRLLSYPPTRYCEAAHS